MCSRHDTSPLWHLSRAHLKNCLCRSFNIINELVDLSLPINIEKSAALHICPSAKKSNHLPSTPPILLSGTPVKVMTEIRLLHAIVDNQLSWSSQVNSVISKVSKKIGNLRRNIHQLLPSARHLSTWQSFNQTLSMQLQQRYLSCPFLCVFASVLCGGGQCAVLPGRIGKQKLPPFHFENSFFFNINRTSFGTPVCCCRAKMCSKIGCSFSVHKTKFYRTLSSNQGKRKFSLTILYLLSARHALIH